MILSVSRRTDIPNYYADWFCNRVKEGYCYVKNPMNPHQISKVLIAPELVDCIVFWTKNPANMLPYLEKIKEYSFYFQFTLTPYGREVEPGLPSKRKEIIKTFQELSNRIGAERVIWRYDPIFITQTYSRDYHKKAFEEIASSLTGYTNRVVISFLDNYAKIQKRMTSLGIQELTDEDCLAIAKELVVISNNHGLLMETCSERIDLQELGIRHGSCIDQERIEQIIGRPLKTRKDRNQRPECGCVESVEIGTYDTCKNGCRYCYATFSQGKVREKIQIYDPKAPLLCGQVGELDRVTVREQR